jgi:hypothetical protein
MLLLAKAALVAGATLALNNFATQVGSLSGGGATGGMPGVSQRLIQVNVPVAGARVGCRRISL